MLRTVWAKIEGRRRLYLVDERCDFVEPVKLYLDHLAALEGSPHTLENYCRHLGRYFTFVRREAIDWRGVQPDDLVRFIQYLRSEKGDNKQLTERSVNTILATVSSFYRYHVQRAAVSGDLGLQGFAFLWGLAHPQTRIVWATYLALACAGQAPLLCPGVSVRR
jgi:hypothetical protein